MSLASLKPFLVYRIHILYHIVTDFSIVADPSGMLFVNSGSDSGLTFRPSRWGHLRQAMQQYRTAVVNCGVPTAQTEALADLLASTAPICRAECYGRLTTFVRFLKTSIHRHEAAIFLVVDARALAGLVEVRGWFREMKIVVVLFGENLEALPEVHRLTPRYITFPERGFRDVAEVIQKMAISEAGKTGEETKK